MTLAAAVLWGLPSAARGMEDEPAEGVQKARVEGVVVVPTDPRKAAGKPVTVILGETEKSRREFKVAFPVGEGADASSLEARTGTREIRETATSRDERYETWVSEGRREESAGPSSGIVVLAQVVSGLEISCPREVSAGEKITLEVTGVGQVDDTWDTWLVYPVAAGNPGDGPTPDGSRYEQQTLKVGAKLGGAKLSAIFTTYKADKGKLLGVCVAREKSADKRVLWVRVK